MDKLVRLAIIGLGRWGSNYIRAIQGMDEFEITWLCAASQSSLDRALAALRASAQITTSSDKAISAHDVDAVIIASPGSTHFDFAKKALKGGKHVLVEKPVAFKASEVEQLITLSELKQSIFMAGHIHLYNPAILRIKQDIALGMFGSIRYLQSIGSGPGPVRNDISALWDYLPHDVSILLHLLGTKPLRVGAQGASYLQKGVDDVVSATLEFPDDVVATVFGSWLHPLKQRKLIVVGERMQAVFDDYADEKLRYYDFDGKESVVPVEGEMPLTVEQRHVFECITQKRVPRTDGQEALRVTQVLEKAQESLADNGQLVNL